jgi:hypothetical protein
MRHLPEFFAHGRRLGLCCRAQQVPQGFERFCCGKLMLVFVRALRNSPLPACLWKWPLFRFQIHWHGFDQVLTLESDGVPGVTQCPIFPGSIITYMFRASQVGTFWYHGHKSEHYVVSHPLESFIGLGSGLDIRSTI